MVNGDKSHFIIHPNAFDTTRDIIKRITRFNRNHGSITYLGCLLLVGRPRIIYLPDLVNELI